MTDEVAFQDNRGLRMTAIELDVSNDFGSGAHYGRGVNFFNPEKVSYAGQTLVVIASMANTALQRDMQNSELIDLSDELISQAGSFRSEWSIREEAELLRANFSVSYKVSSLEAAYAFQRDRKSNKKVVYYIYTATGIQTSIPGRGAALQSDDLAEIDQIDDSATRILRFVSAYGTHFITNITYGCRLAARAEISGVDEREKESISASLNATFGAVSGDASFLQDKRKSLKEENVTVTAELVSGNKDALILTSLDDVLKFLVDLKSKTQKITPGPVHIEVASYFSLLKQSATPNLFEEFKPLVVPGALKAPYGVPVGTVIAWIPPPTSLVVEAGVTRVEPPFGWQLCDGRDGRPNLSDRYLIGTTDGTQVGVEIGANSHRHRVAGTTDIGRGHQGFSPGTQFQAEGNETKSQSYGIDLESDETSSRPLSVQAVFIIRVLEP